MSLTTVRDNPERLEALIDVLCAAASSDDYIAPQEVVVVQGLLEKLLGGSALPEHAHQSCTQFDRRAFELGGALDRLGLDNDEDRQALLAAALAVVVADRFVDSSEFGFIAELADLLGLPLPSQLS